MRLSDRLELVVSFVRPGSRVADVGTDHGYVPIVLTERGIAKSAIAMDVRQGPLERARAHIMQRDLEGQIETRLSDGVAALNDKEADTVIIAGMGGELVIHILRDGKRLWEQIGHWILSPQSELDKVRTFLQEQGFVISREEMLCEAGKYYVVMDVTRGAMEPLSDSEALYGPCLIHDRNPVLKELLEREKKVYSQILGGLERQAGESAVTRRDEIERLLGCVQSVLHAW